MTWAAGVHRKYRGAVIAATFADARDTCIEGESGIEQLIPAVCIKKWNRSIGELELWNDSLIRLFSSDSPERLRGPQFHRAWCDEVASWDIGSQKEALPGQENIPPAWTQLRFTLRLGRKQGLNPKTIVTTTPKPLPLIIKWMADRTGNVHMVTGSTFDNAANLSEDFLEELREAYEGTRLGDQELYARVLQELEGALWKQHMISDYRRRETPRMKELYVALDPPASDGKKSTDAEAGIMLVGRGTDNRGYVILDASMKGSPEEWGARAVYVYKHYRAHAIVGEVNNGGDMVRAVIHAIDDTVKFQPVHATRGKLLRAEPVAALYEQGRVHHLGVFPKLEQQMTTWLPGQKSPDRMDSLVWGVTRAMLVSRTKRLSGIKGVPQGNPYSTTP